MSPNYRHCSLHNSNNIIINTVINRKPLQCHPGELSEVTVYGLNDLDSIPIGYKDFSVFY
jgi:hypothetical protein